MGQATSDTEHPSLRYLTLLPHGHRLLTRSASFWFAYARVVLAAMATIEAMAWGYLGFSFGTGMIRSVAAAVTASVMFLVVWSIDVSFLTFDLASNDHAVAILGQPPHHRGRRQARLFVSLALRVLLVSASLTITAPYLARLVFYEDVRSTIAHDVNEALDSGRARVKRVNADTIDSLDREIKERRAAYEVEVAGKGRSGRYGIGPAATAIRQTVAALEEDKRAAVAAQAQALEQFEALALDLNQNRERLARSYNVTLPQSSLLTNNRAFDALRQRPETQATELAIRVFLFLIFSAMLLLKMFEPQSVRLYLSETLQQEYSRYRVGVFDGLLPASERSTMAGYVMEPQRLLEFLTSTWALVRSIERKQAHGRASSAAVAHELELLIRLYRDVAGEGHKGDSGANAEQGAQQRVEDVRKQVGNMTLERARSMLASSAHAPGWF